MGMRSAVGQTVWLTPDNAQCITIILDSPRIYPEYQMC